MRSNVALVLPRPPRDARDGESPSVNASQDPLPAFRPIDSIVVVIDDRELETLGTLFAMSPLRHAMTFEAYLATRGYARPSERR